MSLSASLGVSEWVCIYLSLCLCLCLSLSLHAESSDVVHVRDNREIRVQLRLRVVQRQVELVEARVSARIQRILFTIIAMEI